MDGIVIFGSIPKERDNRLTAVLTRIQTAGVFVSREKCFFGQRIPGACHGPEWGVS